MTGPSKPFLNLGRRRFLQGVGLAGAAGLVGMPFGRAFAAEPEKPKEIIVRAWGGSWVDSLKAGVSDPFTKLTGIAIRHDWRRQGIARALVEAAARHARARGHAALRAEVAADNPEALAAWRAMGFIRQSRHRLGWPWMRPAHVLRLTL